MVDRMEYKVPDQLFKYKPIDENGHTLDLIKNDLPLYE